MPPEANEEEFKSLMASVTAKLLSHSQFKGGESEEQDANSEGLNKSIEVFSHDDDVLDIEDENDKSDCDSNSNCDSSSDLLKGDTSHTKNDNFMC